MVSNKITLYQFYHIKITQLHVLRDIDSIYIYIHLHVHDTAVKEDTDAKDEGRHCDASHRWQLLVH
jgi:hypothetical protein